MKTVIVILFATLSTTAFAAPNCNKKVADISMDSILQIGQIKNSRDSQVLSNPKLSLSKKVLLASGVNETQYTYTTEGDLTEQHYFIQVTVNHNCELRAVLVNPGNSPGF